MLAIYIRTSTEKGKKESPIEQQRAIGIEFAEKNKFNFTVYEDKGISGYKTADDDLNPFKNRPRFMELIEDIRAGKITKVWVWEHSRLGREGFQMAVINRIFDKYHIRLFEKDKEFNSKDPQEKFLRSVLDAAAELERHQIVGRITRGIHNKINQGRHSFGSLYGYTKTGTDKNGYTVWEPVPSEQENIKFAYKRILEGSTLKRLAVELYNNKVLSKNEAIKASRFWHRLMVHFSYTGYELNMAGSAIFKKFENFEIDNLAMLNNEQYYVKSKNYPHKLVSIANWIKTVEKLQINREARKNNINRASKDLATGLITCNECKQKYYSLTHRIKRKYKTAVYFYYKHYALLYGVEKCTQKKLFTVDNINSIFKLFFFYHYIFFDNTGEMIQEAQRLAKVKIMKLKEEVSKLEKNEKQFKKQLENYESILSETTDKDDILTFGRLKIQTEDKLTANYEDLSKAKIELDQLNEQYSNSDDDADKLLINAKEKVLNFFKANTEEQRNNLFTIIKNCVVFDTQLLIDTGSTIFVFDTAYKHFFNEKLLDELVENENYKEHFSYLFNDDFAFIIQKEQTAETITESIFNPSGHYLVKHDLSNAKDKKSVLNSFKTRGIQYDTENHKSVVLVEPEHFE